MPELDEFTNVLKHIKCNKSPGIDGLPAEFYLKFWSNLSDIYFSMICDAWNVKILPSSTRTSILSTIHKADEKYLLKNYRPLSLTNCDYKIAAFVFANRMQTVISSIINDDQVAYIKGRYIGTTIRNLTDIYEYCEESNEPGALINIDFQKAFDSVEHNFMFSVMKKINFGDNFIQWIQILYNESKFKVKNNGWLSKDYKMTRGIRQGCPVSCLLFLLVVEVMSTKIRKSNNVKGIKIDKTEYKIAQFADDATISVTDLTSILEVVSIIHNYGKVSGLKLNIKKTKGIWLGELKNLGLRVYNNINWTGKPVKCLGIYIGHNTQSCIK